MPNDYLDLNDTAIHAISRQATTRAKTNGHNNNTTPTRLPVEQSRETDVRKSGGYTTCELHEIHHAVVVGRRTHRTSYDRPPIYMSVTCIALVYSNRLNGVCTNTHLVDELLRAHEDTPHRCPKPLGQADRHAVRVGNQLRRPYVEGNRCVPEPCACCGRTTCGRKTAPVIYTRVVHGCAVRGHDRTTTTTYSSTPPRLEPRRA